MRFNPNLEQSWFGSLMEIINNVTMLSIILTGAALIREREHGTIEHLLVMPVTPAEIMLAKVWAWAWWCWRRWRCRWACGARRAAGAHRGLGRAVHAAAALHLFATTSMGIFLATVARPCRSSACC
jgi:ABC-2 type transport system permease protein